MPENRDSTTGKSNPKTPALTPEQKREEKVRSSAAAVFSIISVIFLSVVGYGAFNSHLDYYYNPKDCKDLVNITLEDIKGAKHKFFMAYSLEQLLYFNEGRDVDKITGALKRLAANDEVDVTLIVHSLKDGQEESKSPSDKRSELEEGIRLALGNNVKLYLTTDDDLSEFYVADETKALVMVPREEESSDIRRFVHVKRKDHIIEPLVEEFLNEEKRIIRLAKKKKEELELEALKAHQLLSTEESVVN